MAQDSRVDAYIAKAPPFAQPILEHIRSAVHAARPGVQETIKWGTPFFDYHGTLCMMAAFKSHVRFGFWKGALMRDRGWAPADAEGSGGIGRVRSIEDLPSKAALARLVKTAAKLNEDGVRAPATAARTPKPPVVVPPILKAALAKNADAKARFAAFSPSHRREYVEWITEAKTDATRQRRVEVAVAQIVDGKQRHWKYQRPT